MSDVVERAEGAIARSLFEGNPAILLRELVAELKSARAEAERLQSERITEQSGAPGDEWECPNCSAEWVAEDAGPLDIYWRLRGEST
jgi:hypothetical protein